MTTEEVAPLTREAESAPAQPGPMEQWVINHSGLEEEHYECLNYGLVRAFARIQDTIRADLERTNAGLLAALESIEDQAVLYRRAGVSGGATQWRTGLEVIATQANVARGTAVPS